MTEYGALFPLDFEFFFSESLPPEPELQGVSVLKVPNGRVSVANSGRVSINKFS